MTAHFRLTAGLLSETLMCHGNVTLNSPSSTEGARVGYGANVR